ncbi:MAG: ABC transporter ATP-binding protein [Deltaproteobacteria bacterium]|nr:MAG: ABC transporter ATP-binding protein [Deltaproteobacteria bacterium]
MSALLSLRGVTKRFGGLVANRDVTFDVHEGEIVGLIGPNGAGKSTLFNCIAGYFSPDGGKVFFQGRDITGYSPEKVTHLGIARTFQIVKIFGNMTVRENIMVGAFCRTWSVSRASEEAEAWGTFVGLGGKLDYMAGELTLAEQKWLQLGRALATRPRLLLMDEVFAGLTQAEIKSAVNLIKRIKEEKGITVLIVEHVMDVVMPLSDRVIVLDNGEKIAEGKPEEVSRDERVIRAYLGEE